MCLALLLAGCATGPRDEIEEYPAHFQDQDYFKDEEQPPAPDAPARQEEPPGATPAEAPAEVSAEVSEETRGEALRRAQGDEYPTHFQDQDYFRERDRALAEARANPAAQASPQSAAPAEAPTPAQTSAGARTADPAPAPARVEEYPTHFQDQDYFQERDRALAEAEAEQETQPAPTAAATDGDPERYLPRATKRTDSLQSILEQPTRRRGDEAAPGPAGDRPATYNVPLALPAAPYRDELRVHILNVGTGSCQIVECPGSDEVLVVDCGTMDPGTSDLTRAEVGSYLGALGVADGVKVVLSHPHENHYNRIPTLMGERQAASIWLGGVYEGYGGAAPDRIDDWLDGQAGAGVPVYVGFPAGYGNRGVPVEGLSCGTANTYILTANVGEGPDANSLVLLIEHGSFRIILAGDAEGPTEASVMENFGALIRASSVVVGSKHGSDTRGSNHPAWARRTSPQTVVFSTGTYHGHPTSAAGKRYLDSVFDDVAEHPMHWDPTPGSTAGTFMTTDAVYATAVNGTLVIDSDGSAFTLSCMRDGGTEDCF